MEKGETNKITIGVSSCMRGNEVRFDGGHTYDPYITGTLGTLFYSDEYVFQAKSCVASEYSTPGEMASNGRY